MNRDSGKNDASAASTFVPYVRMRERLARSSEDSDTAYFYDVMSAAELIVKVSVAGLIAATRRDPSAHQYRIEASLVRADGIGDWVAALEELLTGPASEYVEGAGKSAQRQLTRTVAKEEWAGQALASIDAAASLIASNRPGFRRAQLRQWFATFAWLRNKTRGHGAADLDQCAQMVIPLAESVGLLMDNLEVAQWPWAVIRRGASGRYRVTPLGNGSCPSLKELAKRADLALDDGVYVGLDRPMPVRLALCDVDLSDFFLANGSFGNSTYEVLSYVTGDTKQLSSAPFLKPSAPLASSQTTASTNIAVRANVLTNMPAPPVGYVSRLALEREVLDLLLDDRRPVITLGGRGGIGKTSLALQVLDQASRQTRFENIWWFSSRDIDLMPTGPKLVKPDVLTPEDMAREFFRLTSMEADDTSKPSLAAAMDNMMMWLSGSASAGSSLFVFDNFETVGAPADLFSWLDNCVRLPNKVLITTRVRSFRGDYPVEVGGMTEDEFSELVRTVAAQLGIEAMITPLYTAELFTESDGHPYVAKILLGEVDRTRKVGSVERIMGSREDILTALFERTFNLSLSPAGQRVFLTLCGWRSVVSELAVKAALLRPGNDRIDVGSAIEELVRSSLVEAIDGPEGQRFVSIPLAAQLFGRAKLRVAASKAAIESDLTVLRAFGVAQEADIERGMRPRIDALMRAAQDDFPQYRPVVEYVANHYPPAWLQLADHYLQEGDRENEAEAISHYLEARPTDPAAWKRMAASAVARRQPEAEMNSLLQLVELPRTPYREISDACDRFNYHHSNHQLSTETLEKRAIAQRLRDLMESRLSEADARDLSRLGWICMHLQDVLSAHEYARRGLVMEPHNPFCRKLLEAQRT